MLRCPVEQAHAALFLYKILRGQDHRAFRCIGRRVIEAARRRFDSSSLPTFPTIYTIPYLQYPNPYFFTRPDLLYPTLHVVRFGGAGWGLEQEETCEAWLDYLTAIQFHNHLHAKFARRMSPALQVTPASTS